jgi:phosphatidate cytidylyltransferase
VATVGLRSLLKYTDYGVDPAVIETFRPRIRTWWILFGLLACVFFISPVATTFLFFFLSITILREYITLTPKSPADHQTLFWIYVVFTPLQFALVGINPDWFVQVTGFMPYKVFSLLLPGYVFFFLPGMMAISGDPKRFFECTAKLQLGLIVCVYSLSYAPALLTLNLPHGSPKPEPVVLDNHLAEMVIRTFGEPNEVVE